jgi:hypothetical protein
MEIGYNITNFIYSFLIAIFFVIALQQVIGGFLSFFDHFNDNDYKKEK